MRSILSCAALGLALAGCQSGEGAPASGPTEAFSAIEPSEIIYLTGTEPFWGGEVKGEQALYTTPENQDGSRFEVTRFAGNNGLALTGLIDDRNFDLTVTPGECSDGMSDRTYPYTATLRIGEEQREGCAWTNRQPFDGPQRP